MGVRVIKHGGSEKKELKNKILSTNRNLKKQSTTHKQYFSWRFQKMSEVKIIGDAVKNMPWQEGPAEFSGAPVWRYGENPIIGRNPVKEVARIFNSAVMPYGDEFIGVFRGEQTNGIPYIYLGRSKDAIHWNFDENKIQFVDEDVNPFMPV